MFKKRMFFTLLMLFFVCITLAIGSPKPAMAKEIKLIFAHYVPPVYKDLFPSLKAFPDYINEHGKGKVHVDHFHSGSLLKAKQLLPGLMQGTADIVLQVDSLIMGTYPILGITELPFLYKDMESSYEKLKIGTPLYELMNKELAKKNLFALATWPILPEYIWTTNKLIRKPEDLKGLRIRAAGRVEAKVVKALGGASVSMSSAELYEALKRGTIDGAMCTWTTITSRGLQETIKYVTKSSFASYSVQLLCRLDKWNSFPPDVREVITEAGKVFGEAVFKYGMPYWEKETWPAIRKAGVKEIVLTKSEEKEFKKRVTPVLDWWKTQLPPGVGEKAIELATK